MAKERIHTGEQGKQDRAVETARKADEIRKAEAAAGIFAFGRRGCNGKVGDIEWFDDHPHRIISVRCFYRDTDWPEVEEGEWVVEGKVQRIEGPEVERLITEKKLAQGRMAADHLSVRLCGTFNRFCGGYGSHGSKIGTPCAEPQVPTVCLAADFLEGENGERELYGYAEVAFDRDTGTLALRFNDGYGDDHEYWRAVVYSDADAVRLALLLDTLVRWNGDGLPLNRQERYAEEKRVFDILGSLGTPSPAPEGTRFDPPDAGGLEFDDIDGPVIESVDVDEDGGFNVGIGR